MGALMIQTEGFFIHIEAFSFIVEAGDCVHILAIDFVSTSSTYSTTEQYKLLSNFKVERLKHVHEHQFNKQCLYVRVVALRKCRTTAYNRRDGANRLSELIPQNENETLPMPNIVQMLVHHKKGDKEKAK